MTPHERKIRTEIQTLSAQLREITVADALEKRRRFVGRYFKFADKFSYGAGTSGPWIIYAHVRSIDLDGSLTGTSFFIDSDGKASVDVTASLSGVTSNPTAWEEISAAEYDLRVAELGVYIAKVLGGDIT